jgi:hypothetical protein
VTAALIFKDEVSAGSRCPHLVLQVVKRHMLRPYFTPIVQYQAIYLSVFVLYDAPGDETLLWRAHLRCVFQLVTDIIGVYPR